MEDNLKIGFRYFAYSFNKRRNKAELTPYSNKFKTVEDAEKWFNRYGVKLVKWFDRKLFLNTVVDNETDET